MHVFLYITILSTFTYTWNRFEKNRVWGKDKKHLAFSILCFTPNTNLNSYQILLWLANRKRENGCQVQDKWHMDFGFLLLNSLCSQMRTKKTIQRPITFCLAVTQSWASTFCLSCLVFFIAIFALNVTLIFFSCSTLVLFKFAIKISVTWLDTVALPSCNATGEFPCPPLQQRQVGILLEAFTFFGTWGKRGGGILMLCDYSQVWLPWTAALPLFLTHMQSEGCVLQLRVIAIILPFPISLFVVWRLTSNERRG